MSDEQYFELRERSLHEPVFPFFSSVYSSILSAINGVSLAVLLLYTAETIGNACSFYQELLTFLKAAVVFLSIVVVWHKYTTHNRYVAWPLWWLDSMIPFLFGVCEFMFALQVKESASLAGFSFWMWSLSFLGFLAYCHSFVRYRKYKTTVKRFYHEHYDNHDFEKALYVFIDRFNKVCIWGMVKSMLIFGGGAVVSLLYDRYFLRWRFLELVIPCVFLFWLYRLLDHCDLRSALTRDEKMAKYFK